MYLNLICDAVILCATMFLVFKGILNITSFMNL